MSPKGITVLQAMIYSYQNIDSHLSGTTSLSEDCQGQSVILTAILYRDSDFLSSEPNSFIIPGTKMKRELLSQDH